ncbi:MAG: bifunctional (p)ppGpp synthetase/guanosine-3',5'-bis(diphosphate) 3'-pyrophosphohydrolase [Bacillota bacterium]|nr:bifunctional (p)ppGpp synthetase/guanosine-3',5'-bis(diphosphate) 3'-pyrophosphohydrolase [Bacillota bacterium]
MLVEKLTAYYPGADLDLVEKAYRFALQAHEGQRRASGECYIFHPLAVALLLTELEMDPVGIAAALLHDVAEDTGVTLAQIESRFGKQVADLVDGVTKLGRLGFASAREAQAENLRKMILAMAQDLRVVIIKLADRLHNMRTLGYLPPEKQRKIADETLEIYAPLAHRLGVWRFKWELEDLSFRYRDPERYRQLVGQVARRREEREAQLARVIEALRERLGAAGIRADIQGRAKHLWSIHRKMVEQGRDLSDIYDLIAVRVIVDTVPDCYAALGVVHSLWKPVPARFKDFISVPKPNMYQSLHTTVIGPTGEPFEVQIRTWEMHRTAEYGVAAHWRYKEGGRAGDRRFEEKLSWLRQLLEWSRDLRDAQEFMDSLRIDIFSDQVFVFTPKGDVIDLPAGATPLDFAYRVHTEVGHSCVGAKVNGRIVPLDHTLENGDIVEILTSRHSRGPSPDWLQMVRTSGARSKIRAWFKKQRREENIASGRESLDRELRALGLDAREVRPAWLDELATELNFPAGDDLLAAIGYGAVSAQRVATRLGERLGRPAPGAPAPGPAAPTRPSSQGVLVRGVGDVLVRFSRCCTPIPGDPIIGYVTRGRGVSIHRLDCPNVRALARDSGRLVEVSWDAGADGWYPVEMQVRGLDRPGMLSEVTAVVADARANILSARAWADKGGLALIDLVLQVHNLRELDELARRIRKIKDVVSVERVVRESRTP